MTKKRRAPLFGESGPRIDGMRDDNRPLARATPLLRWNARVARVLEFADASYVAGKPTAISNDPNGTP